MSELISVKEALIALANGQEVLWRTKTDAEIKCFKRQTPNLESVLSGDSNYRFWIKPRTITINGIEVPAPFEPKEGDWLYFIAADREFGYSSRKLHANTPKHLTLLGAWRTEEEVKQVVAALRCVFGGES